jgi:anti-sigma B factor antagonist
VFEIEVVDENDVCVCRPVGELDAMTVAEFRERLVGLADRGRVVIDLGDVPFMDSTGLGALIGGIRRIREAGGEASVACRRPAVLRLLHTTGFDRMVSVADSVEEAAAQLGAVADADER